jgi:hypothetical protein
MQSTRPLHGDQYSAYVIARLLDFFADTTPWPRRLWDISNVLALHEATEAGDWVRRRVLGGTALEWYCHALERQLGPDRGLGDTQLRRELTGLLRSKLAPDSRERRRLIQLMPYVTSGYVQRWAAAIDSPKPPSPERLARTLATHLLDLGHSTGSLHRWVFGLSKNTDATLADLLRQAAELAEGEDQIFEVLVPFVSVPDPKRLAAHLAEWRSPSATAAWLRERKVANPPRHNGAFVYHFSAKDAAAAVRAAAANVRRLQARRSYARGAPRRLVPVGRAWVAGYVDPFLLDPPGRGASVLSLESERTMYMANANERLDEALELAAPLNGGPSAAAAAGAWAAIESLLSHPGDQADIEEGKVVAADRLAAITTCSWPRAELTALSYRHHPLHSDPLTEALTGCGSNLERSTLVANALIAGTPLAVASPSDAAAAERMTAVLANPRSQLADVRTIIASVFRRLYRQRNIVLHGGSTAAIALDATLRTSAPLLGAGLDRLVHAQLTDNIEPLDLAARAENSLSLVGDQLGPAAARLLECQAVDPTRSNPGR